MQIVHAAAVRGEPPVVAPTTGRDESEPDPAPARSLADALLDSPLGGVVVADRAGRVSRLNALAERALGRRAAEAIGEPVGEVLRFVDATTRAPVPCPLSRAVAGEGAVLRAVSLVSSEGWQTPVQGVATPLAAGDAGAVLVFQDLTEIRQLERHLAQHLHGDPLTGLATRVAFERTLAQVESAGEPGAHALVHLQLERLAHVNEALGREAGDALLRAVTALLLRRAGDGDLVARLGGDEFALLLRDCPRERAAGLAREIVAAAERLPEMCGAPAGAAGLCAGVAPLAPRAVSPALVAAQAACEAARAQSAAADRVGVWHGRDADADERQLAMHWLPRIGAAWRSRRFSFRTQEIRPLATRGVPMHYEVLLRMLDEDGAEIMPGEFIPAAERSGLMPALDRWIIRSVFERLGRGPGDSGRARGATYCINLSGASLGDPTLVDYIRGELARVRLPPQAICFEITETAAVTSLREAGALTRSLKTLGFKLALDDFGAGLSSFAYLKSLAVDYLKIEGGFVRDVASNRESRAIVEAINGVGHALGLRTIAECVESRAALAALREIGVDFAQGHGLARPQPFEP